MYRMLHLRSYAPDAGESIRLPKEKFAKWWRKMAEVNVSDNDAKNDISGLLEHLWGQFNDDGYGAKNPLATPQGQAKVKASGTHHTSMSIGDVIKVGTNYYIAVSVGFAKLKVN